MTSHPRPSLLCSQLMKILSRPQPSMIRKTTLRSAPKAPSMNWVTWKSQFTQEEKQKQTEKVHLMTSTETCSLSIRSKACRALHLKKRSKSRRRQSTVRIRQLGWWITQPLSSTLQEKVRERRIRGVWLRRPTRWSLCRHQASSASSKPSLASFLSSVSLRWFTRRL